MERAMARVGILFAALCCLLVSSGAYDPVDPDPMGNITVRWDIKKWTQDGYVAQVSVMNFQQYRHIQAPGWELGWVWSNNEVLWYVQGAEVLEQGDCSKFKENVPYSCKTNPAIVDLLPGAPYGMQTANCCRGGVLSSLAQDPSNSVASFEISVGQTGNSVDTVLLPVNFTLKAPGPGYTCTPATKLEPSKFSTPAGRRTTQAHMTWSTVCTYSQYVAMRSPSCCVSLSSFYSKELVTCPSCACSCQSNCVGEDSPYLGSVMNDQNKNSLAPLVQCTSHMCPIRVHWHVKANYKGYWAAKITVTNLNYRTNYSQWNLVAQHPNFNTLTRISSFNYTALTNDTVVLWGIKHYNDLLLNFGPDGYVQTEVLFQKDPTNFTLQAGWAFPRSMYFNGDKCVMPPPDAYPSLPNASPNMALILPLFFLVVFPLLFFLALRNFYF